MAIRTFSLSRLSRTIAAGVFSLFTSLAPMMARAEAPSAPHVEDMTSGAFPDGTRAIVATGNIQKGIKYGELSPGGFVDQLTLVNPIPGIALFNMVIPNIDAQIKAGVQKLPTLIYVRPTVQNKDVCTHPVLSDAQSDALAQIIRADQRATLAALHITSVAGSSTGLDPKVLAACTDDSFFTPYAVNHARYKISSASMTVATRDVPSVPDAPIASAPAAPAPVPATVAAPAPVSPPVVVPDFAFKRLPDGTVLANLVHNPNRDHNISRQEMLRNGTIRSEVTLVSGGKRMEFQIEITRGIHVRVVNPSNDLDQAAVTRNINHIVDEARQIQTDSKHDGVGPKVAAARGVTTQFDKTPAQKAADKAAADAKSFLPLPAVDLTNGHEPGEAMGANALAVRQAAADKAERHHELELGGLALLGLGAIGSGYLALRRKKSAQTPSSKEEAGGAGVPPDNAPVDQPEKNSAQQPILAVDPRFTNFGVTGDESACLQTRLLDAWQVAVKLVTERENNAKIDKKLDAQILAALDKIALLVPVAFKDHALDSYLAATHVATYRAKITGAVDHKTLSTIARNFNTLAEQDEGAYAEAVAFVEQHADPKSKEGQVLLYRVGEQRRAMNAQPVPA